MSSLSKLYRWVETLLGSPSKDRLEVVESIKKRLKALRLEQTDEMLAAVHDGRLELIGIAPEVSYLRVKGDADDLGPIWVHRFGTPKLLLKVKGAPLLIIAGTQLKLDESDVTALNGRGHEVKGITG